MDNDFLRYAKYAKSSYSKDHDNRFEFDNDSLITFEAEDFGERKLFIVLAGTDDMADVKDSITDDYNIEKARSHLWNARIGSFIRGQKIVLVGHSRGGRLAVALGADMKARGLNVEKIVTFGCPKVDLNVTKVPHFRIVNRADPVPNLPPFFYGCHHHVKPIYLGGKPKWWRRFLFVSNAYKYHPIDEYISSL